MKIRKGFVSNSSSSSFVCDVCGNDVSGWDMSLTDAEMYECNAGHTFCDSHADMESRIETLYPTIESKRAYCLEHSWGESDKQEIINAADDEIPGYFSDILEEEDDSRYGLEVELCPCCTLKDPTSGQVLDFLLHKNGTTFKDTVQEFQMTFANWQKFLEVSKK